MFFQKLPLRPLSSMPPLPPFPIRAFAKLPRHQIAADAGPAAAPAPVSGTASAAFQPFAARGIDSSAQARFFLRRRSHIPHNLTWRPNKHPPHPDPQVLLEEGIAGKIDDAAKVVEANVGKIFSN